MDKPKIHKDYLASSWYGVSFDVEAWQPEGGRAFVYEVNIEGLPPIKRPDIPDADSLQEALDAGLRFATSMIDN